MKMKKYILAMLLISIVFIAGCGMKKTSYNTEKITIEQAEREQEQTTNRTFEVVNVGSHIQIGTNNYGAITHEDRMLTYSFINDESNVITEEILFNKAKIIGTEESISRIDKKGDNITLYLTREMLNKLY